MGTSKNIIVGAAQVFLGPSINSGANGAEVPVETWKPTAAAGRYGATVAGTTGWNDIGYTTGGLTVATAPSWTDVEVDQLLDAAKIFKDKMSLTIGTEFAEATLDNLLIAWGQNASFVQNTTTVKEINIEGGALGEAPLERGLIAVGNAPEQGMNKYGERTYFAYRVLSVEASSHALARAAATTVPVSFRCLPADSGLYGSVRDRLNVV